MKQKCLNITAFSHFFQEGDVQAFVFELSSLMNSQYVVLDTPTVAGITTKAALYTL